MVMSPPPEVPSMRLSPAGVETSRICRVKHRHVVEVYVVTKSGNATGDICLRYTECFNTAKKGTALPNEREAACVQKLCWLSEIRGQMHSTVKRDVKRTIANFKVSSPANHRQRSTARLIAESPSVKARAAATSATYATGKIDRAIRLREGSYYQSSSALHPGITDPLLSVLCR